MPDGQMTWAPLRDDMLVRALREQMARREAMLFREQFMGSFTVPPATQESEMPRRVPTRSEQSEQNVQRSVNQILQARARTLSEARAMPVDFGTIFPSSNPVTHTFRLAAHAHREVEVGDRVRTSRTTPGVVVPCGATHARVLGIATERAAPGEMVRVQLNSQAIMPLSNRQAAPTIRGIRGCGTRTRGGVYVEAFVGGYVPVGTAPDATIDSDVLGRISIANTRISMRPSLESLLYTTPMVEGTVGEASWFRPHRTPIAFDRDGVTHLVVWVGEEHYPNVWDFIEETRHMGASRRVPRTMDFGRLSAESRLFFVHPHAMASFTDVPSELAAPAQAMGTRLDRAKLLPTRSGHGYENEDTEVAGRDAVVRTLPCGASYQRFDMLDTRFATQAAVFMHLPLSRIAIVEDHDGMMSEQVSNRVARARGVQHYRARA